VEKTMMTTPGRTLRLAPGLLVLLLAGCADTADQGVSNDAAAELEANAPDGRYAASYVLESSNVPGTQDFTEATSTYAFTLDQCDDSRCSGTVQAPAEGRYTWDGSELVVTFDEIAKKDSCMSRHGQPLKGSTFWSSTEHWANLTSAGTSARLEGSYQQETVFSDFTNGCDPDGADRQWATFTLMLRRE
jgi:hypothetical protein